MKPTSSGNGSNKFDVFAQDQFGWVRVFCKLEGPQPAELPLALSDVLSEWFRQRPHLKVRTIVPIQKDGDTVELHAWYDCHVFHKDQGSSGELK
jgi:hypothetical protein